MKGFWSFGASWTWKYFQIRPVNPKASLGVGGLGFKVWGLI